MTLHDVLRAIVRGESALLNDAKWVERAVRAIAAHEAKYPSPAVAAAPEPAAAPDARDDKIAELEAQLAAQTPAAPPAPAPETPQTTGAQEAWISAVQAGAVLPGPDCSPLERQINLHVAELHPAAAEGSPA